MASSTVKPPVTTTTTETVASKSSTVADIEQATTILQYLEDSNGLNNTGGVNGQNNTGVYSADRTCLGSFKAKNWIFANKHLSISN